MKRLLDIAVAASLLVTLLPAFAFVTLVPTALGRPLLFRQQPPGLARGIRRLGVDIRLLIDDVADLISTLFSAPARWSTPAMFARSSPSATLNFWRAYSARWTCPTSTTRRPLATSSPFVVVGHPIGLSRPAFEARSSAQPSPVSTAHAGNLIVVAAKVDRPADLADLVDA